MVGVQGYGAAVVTLPPLNASQFGGAYLLTVEANQCGMYCAYGGSSYYSVSCSLTL